VQIVEIIDKRATFGRKVQTIDPAILQIRASFKEFVLHETIKQPNQRDRSQFKNICQVNLRSPFLLPQLDKYHPLGVGRTAPLDALIYVLAKEQRTFDHLDNQLMF